MNRVDRSTEADEPLGLGIALAAIQVAVFFAFIGYCAFATRPALVAQQGIPAPFLFGLAVIACGVLLTVVYVLISNRREPGHD